MTLIEEVGQILDNYIVMKELTDDEIFRVELRKQLFEKLGCFSLHRRKSGNVYDIRVYEDAQTIKVTRNKGIYLESELLVNEEFSTIKINIVFDETPIHMYDSFGKRTMNSVTTTNNIIWTVYDAKSFEVFMKVIDRVI